MSPSTFLGCIVIAALVGWASTSVKVRSGEAQTAADDVVLALIDGKEVTWAQVERKWKTEEPANYGAMEARRTEMIARMLDRLIAEEVVESEAQGRGISVEELLKQEVPQRAASVTAEEIAAETERLRGQTNASVPAEDMRPAVVQYLTQKRMLEARDAYIEGLRSSSRLAIRILMKPVRETIQILPTDPAMGPPDAPVTLVVFSDFECPYCRQLEPTLKQLQERFDGRIRLVWKDFPQPSHRRAKLAARAAQCAHDQGRFFSYRDKLFANPETLQRSDLLRHARDLGLEEVLFQACLDDRRVERRIEVSLNEGSKLGVTGTPTVFINGRAISGAVPLAVLEKSVSEELKAGAVLPSWLEP